MRVWQPAHAAGGPGPHDPHLAVDPLVQRVLDPARSVRSLTLRAWWEDEVARATRWRTPDLTRAQVAGGTASGASGASADESPPRTAPQDLLARLSTREHEVLALLARGLTNREMAERLVLAPSTVSWYVKQVYLKLGAHNRVQAAAHLQPPR